MPSLWRSLGRGEPGDSEIRRAVRISLLEAAVVGAMFAATEMWLVPLLQQRLGALAHVIGLLTIIPLLGVIVLGAFARPLIAALGGNRRTCLLMSSLQVAFLAALAIPAQHPYESWAIPAALALSVAIGLAQTVVGPAWISWMAEIVPRPLMGRYQGWRVRIFLPMKLAIGFGFASLVATFPPEYESAGLVAVFLIAAASRAASVWLLSLQPDMPPRPVLRGPDSQRHPPAQVTLLDFIRTMPATDIGRWTMVWSALWFGVTVANPFFAVYMIESTEAGGLALDPMRYWWLCNVAVVTRFLFVPVMGRLVDMVGAASVLRVAVIGITVIPTAWILTGDLRWLVAVEVLSGLSWCAAEISVGTLLFSCNRDAMQRVRLIGFHQVVAGSAIVLGSLAGTELLRHHVLPPIDGSEFKTLFLVSMALRVPAVVMALILLPRLRPLDAEETAGLWRLVPGSGVTMSLGRGLLGVFRRQEG